jgi:hypothetical protein
VLVKASRVVALDRVAERLVRGPGWAETEREVPSAQGSVRAGPEPDERGT